MRKLQDRNVVLREVNGPRLMIGKTCSCYHLCGPWWELHRYAQPPLAAAARLRRTRKVAGVPSKDKGHDSGKANAKKPKTAKAGNRPHEIREREALKTRPS